MKTLILASAILAIGLVVGCAKKDDGGGGGGPACGPGAVPSPALGTCVAQAQCPVGLAQNPNEPSMCMDVRTGQSVFAQQCGVGYFLTSRGCMARGPCQNNTALYGDQCIDVIAAGTANPYPNAGGQIPVGGQPGYPGYGQTGGGYLPSQPIGGSVYGQGQVYGGGVGYGAGYPAGGYGGAGYGNPYYRPF